MLLLQPKLKRRGARVVEEARLESLYTPKAYRGFESLSLRKQGCKSMNYVIYTLYYTQNLFFIIVFFTMLLEQTIIIDYNNQVL